MSQYQVHKFGGASLRDAASIEHVKTLLTGKDEIIIVSALYGTTQALQSTLDAMCQKQTQSAESTLTEISAHHQTCLNELLTPELAKAQLTALDNDIEDIKSILHSVSLVAEYSEAVQARVLSYGEQWSAKLLAACLGQHHKTVYVDASAVVAVTLLDDSVDVHWKKTKQALDHYLQEQLQNQPWEQLIITGFIAHQDQQLVTLGRNGSDFSAAIFAQLFQAKSLTLWKDVQGLYSADPSRVPAAFILPSVSYKEALELAYFGAGVIHPQTIGPMMASGIPIDIKHYHHPDKAGTRIGNDYQNADYLIRGLTSIDHIALINIEGSGLIGVSGIAATVFQVMREQHISVIMISQASSEHSICFAIRQKDAEQAVAALREYFAYDIEQKRIERIAASVDLSIIACVGENMVGTPGITAKMSQALANAHVNIHAIAQGSSERNISVVVASSDENKALRAVHSGFYLSDKTITVGVIGPGNVGATLLAQMAEVMDSVEQRYQAKIELRGVMNSKKMLLSHTAIEWQDWQGALDRADTAASVTAFADYLSDDQTPHKVIIDCTSNQAVADHYLRLLEQGFHLVTPNKKANSGDYDYYQKLKNTCRTHNSYYLYETTVCAGLPIITTLQDLIHTGDDIIEISGVVSGTLSYIFNALAEGLSFSDAVLSAKEKGYTEPDPRDDLSGMDVARKFVCLAREMGLSVDLAQLDVPNLTPEPLCDVSVDQCLAELSQYDSLMQDKVSLAMQRGEKLAYVGSVRADGTVKIEIQSFPASHALAKLQGTDNMLLFRSRRYDNEPLIVQGPGAGPEVTASGVFADLLRLVSYL